MYSVLLTLLDVAVVAQDDVPLVQVLQGVSPRVVPEQSSSEGKFTTAPLPCENQMAGSKIVASKLMTLSLDNSSGH